MGEPPREARAAAGRRARSSGFAAVPPLRVSCPERRLPPSLANVEASVSNVRWVFSGRSWRGGDAGACKY